MTSPKPEKTVRAKYVPLPYGVGVPRMSIDGVHYYLVWARFTTWVEAENYISLLDRKDLVILSLE